MKKTLKMMATLLCVAAVATFSSCSKDNNSENNNGNNDASIIGKWEVVKNTYNDNGNDFGHDSRMGHIWEFKTGGIVSMNGENADYSISGNDIVIQGGLLYGSITSLTNFKLVLDLVVAMSQGGHPYPTEHIEFDKK